MAIGTNTWECIKFEYFSSLCVSCLVTGGGKGGGLFSSKQPKKDTCYMFQDIHDPVTMYTVDTTLVLATGSRFVSSHYR